MALAADLDARPLRAPTVVRGRRQRRRRRRTGRWIIALTVLVGYLLQVLWRLWLVRHLNAPAAHGDEDGYLLAARVLAGGPGGHSTQNEGFARYGYSLLITPAYWFGWDAFGVYRRVQVINALVNATVLPLAYLLTRRAMRLPPGWAIGAGMIAATLPAVTFYGEFALSDAVCAPLALAWLLALHGWAGATSPRRRWAWAIGAGAAVGMGFSVHVRFSVALAVHLVVALVLAGRRISPVAPAAGSIATATLFGLLNRVLAAVIGDRLVLDGLDGTTPTWHALTSLGGLSRAAVNGAGQLWYLMISTWGLGAFGLLVGAWLVTRRPLRLDPARVLVAAAFTTTLGVALATAAALPPDGRTTYHTYPRYLAFLAPFWLLLGVAAVRRMPEARTTARLHRRHALVLALASCALMGGLAVLVLVWFRHQLPHESFLAFDAPEASWLSQRWSRLGLLRASVAAGALLLASVFALRSRRLAGAGVVGLLVVNLVALGQITTRISEPMVVPQYVTAPTLAALGVHDGDRVSVSTRVRWAVRYNDSREVSWDTLATFDDELQGPAPDATVVIAPSDFPDPRKNWDGTRWGWYRLGGSADQRWSAWRRSSLG